MIDLLAVTATLWGCVMGIAPILQIRRMHTTRSSRDISIGWLAVLVPGFVIWVTYGFALGSAALVISNSVSLGVGLATIAFALHYRRVGRSATIDEARDAPASV